MCETSTTSTAVYYEFTLAFPVAKQLWLPLDRELSDPAEDIYTLEDGEPIEED